MQVRALTDEAERQSINRFLRALIAEPSGAPMLSAGQERQARVDSLVLGAYEEHRMVGGLWAGDPYTEFMIDPSMATWPREQQALLVTHFTMLHHVAVDEAHRGQGIGRRLLAELLAYAKARAKVAVYGVADPASVDFYRAAGFNVAGTDETIYLSVGSQTFFFPMKGGRHRWFACSWGGAFARGGASFGPPPAGSS
ncbi:MAG: Acetyltransferase domain [Actinomycetota bacterium]|nr:Acetyltransferase domain [Actinomycetota bacterium]